MPKDDFLAPLKSRDAVAPVGSNCRFDVKFTCKPGEHCLIRPSALPGIKKAFVKKMCSTLLRAWVWTSCSGQLQR